MVYICPGVNHLPSQTTYRAPVTMLRVAEKVERGASLLIDTIDIGTTVNEHIGDLLRVFANGLMER